MQPGSEQISRQALRGIVGLLLLGAVIPLGRYVIAPALRNSSLDTRLFAALITAPVAMMAVILAVAPRPLRTSLAWPGAPVRWFETFGTALLMVPVVVVLSGASAVLLHAVHMGTGSERQQVLQAVLRSGNPALRLALLLLVAVVAPVLEELFFRGFIFSAFAGWSLVVAQVVSALTFALAHMEPAGFLGFFAVGWYLGGLRARTGSVRACIALHAAYNGILLAVTLSLLLLQRRLSPGPA